MVFNPFLLFGVLALGQDESGMARRESSER